MFGVLVVDLDGFKAVNDTHGHAVGDVVLTAAAQNLRACSGGLGCGGARWGDEFVIMATNLHSRADAEHIAVHIRDEFSKPLTSAQGNIKVGASMGIALFPKMRPGRKT